MLIIILLSEYIYPKAEHAHSMAYHMHGQCIDVQV